MSTVIIGVLALQGAFVEHITLLQKAAATCGANNDHTSKHDDHIDAQSTSSVAAATSAPPPASSSATPFLNATPFDFIQVRTPAQLQSCHALVIPGGESTSISLIAERTGLLQPLRDFVKVQRRPVWGTCAGLILLAESANRSKATGQELIGGLDVRVQRNYFGRQVESFEADLDLPFLGQGPPFHSVFIRAPVVEQILTPTSTADFSDPSAIQAPALKATSAPVEVLATLPGRARAIRNQTITADSLGDDGDIVAVKQGNVFGTAFHPELTGDCRIHAWWLQEVLQHVRGI